jgi:hypothetical protein
MKLKETFFVIIDNHFVKVIIWGSHYFEREMSIKKSEYYWSKGKGLSLCSVDFLLDIIDLWRPVLSRS